MGRRGRAPDPANQEKVRCPCGTTFTARRKAGRRYCSRACYGQYGRGDVGREDVQCPCGTAFTASRAAQRRYCSQECFHRYNVALPPAYRDLRPPPSQG